MRDILDDHRTYDNSEALHVGVPTTFEGYVDDFSTPVAAMQFSLDGGENWTTYPMEGITTDRGIKWQFTYTPVEPGRYLLKARAIDANGNASPLSSNFAFEVLP